MRRTILSVVCASVISLAGSAAFAAEKVNIGAPSWTGAQAIPHLIQVIVTEKIGGEASLVTGTNATIFLGMDQGKGDVDVHPDVWLPNQENFTKQYVDYSAVEHTRCCVFPNKLDASRRSAFTARSGSVSASIAPDRRFFGP